MILPAGNQKDLEEIDQTVRAALRFLPVDQADQVLAEALSIAPQPSGDSSRAVVEELANAGQSVTALRQ